MAGGVEASGESTGELSGGLGSALPLSSSLAHFVQETPIGVQFLPQRTHTEGEAGIGTANWRIYRDMAKRVPWLPQRQEELCLWGV